MDEHGHVATDQHPDAVRRSVELDAGTAAVWDAVTRPEHLADWLEAAEVTFVAEPGAGGRFVGVDGEHRTAVVEEVVDERRLVFRWWPDDDGGAASRVELDLTPSPRGTRLTVVEAPLPRAATATVTASATATAALGAGGGDAWAWRLGVLQLDVWALART